MRQHLGGHLAVHQFDPGDMDDFAALHQQDEIPGVEFQVDAHQEVSEFTPAWFRDDDGHGGHDPEVDCVGRVVHQYPYRPAAAIPFQGVVQTVVFLG